MIDDTQSVGWSTWVITSIHSILLRCSLTFGCKEMGHFLGACLTGWTSEWSQIVHSPKNLPIPVNSIWKLFNQVISGFDGLGCCRGCSRLDCCCCGEWGHGLEVLVLGWITVTAQFILTTANLFA